MIVVGDASLKIHAVLVNGHLGRPCFSGKSLKGHWKEELLVNDCSLAKGEGTSEKI